jgi:hypothetical protein
MPIYKIEVTRVVEYKTTMQFERADEQAALKAVACWVAEAPSVCDFEVVNVTVNFGPVRKLDEAQMTEFERYEAAKSRANIVAVLRRYIPVHPVQNKLDWDYECSCPLGSKFVPFPENDPINGPDEVGCVNSRINYWHCSCCGCEGGALDVVMHWENLSFADGLARLEQFINEDKDLPLPDEPFEEEPF